MYHAGKRDKVQKLDGEVRDEVELGLGLTLSIKNRSSAAREESQRTGKNEN